MPFRKVHEASEDRGDESRVSWGSLEPAPGHEAKRVVRAKIREPLQQTYGCKLDYLFNAKIKYSWSQLELDQVLTLVIE